MKFTLVSFPHLKTIKIENFKVIKNQDLNLVTPNYFFPKFTNKYYF